MTPEAAIDELFQAPLDAFVAERKRLAAELRTAGDAKAAKQLLALHRPPLSAWAVNQLWWNERGTFAALIATADQVAKGDLSATVNYRDQLAKLRKAAKRILTAAGHPPADEMLRRVSTTLAAVAANDGFAPDPPGALTEDRAPPGFDAMELDVPDPPAVDDAKVERERAAARREAAEKADQEEEARRVELAEQARSTAREQERRTAARERVMEALRDARAELRVRERDVRSLERQLAAAKGELDDARATVARLEDESRG